MCFLSINIHRQIYFLACESGRWWLLFFSMSENRFVAHKQMNWAESGWKRILFIAESMQPPTATMAAPQKIQYEKHHHHLYTIVNTRNYNENVEYRKNSDIKEKCLHCKRTSTQSYLTYIHACLKRANTGGKQRRLFRIFWLQWRREAKEDEKKYKTEAKQYHAKMDYNVR